MTASRKDWCTLHKVPWLRRILLMVDLVSPDPDLAMKAGRQIVHRFRDYLASYTSNLVGK